MKLYLCATQTWHVPNLEMLSRHHDATTYLGLYIGIRQKSISSSRSEYSENESWSILLYIQKLPLNAVCSIQQWHERDMRTSFCYYAESYFVLFLPFLLWLVITLWNVLYVAFKLKFFLSYFSIYPIYNVQTWSNRFSNSFNIATWPNWEKMI